MTLEMSSWKFHNASPKSKVNRCLLPVLAWYLLFWYSVGYIERGYYNFFIPIRYGYLTLLVFLITFGSMYHAKKDCPSTVWFRIVSTQIISPVYKNSLTFIFVTKYQHLTGITILISMATRSFDTIIDVGKYYHAFHYIPAQPLVAYLLWSLHTRVFQPFILEWTK